MTSLSQTIIVFVAMSMVVSLVASTGDEGAADISLSKAPSGSPSMPLPALVERLTNETYYDFVEDRSRVTVVLFYATWHAKSVQLMRTMEEVAEMFAQWEEGHTETREAGDARPLDAVVRFGAMHGPHYKSFCRELGIRTFPILRVIVRGHVSNHHTYTGHSFSSKELHEFIQTVVTTDNRRAAKAYEEKVQESLKVPVVVNPAPGTVLELSVADYLKFRNSTNILLFVLFYAPWCQHCKGPQQTLKAVADYFSLDRTVVIGKLDCEVNSTFCVETLNLDGYPTFLTVPKPSMAKPGSIYRGGHDVVDIYQHLDIQNQYFEAEGMDEVRKQFEKIRNTPREELPEDLSELGGMFAQFKPKKKDDEGPKKIGRQRGRRY